MTNFMHMIDAPSLALIVPLLHRGLLERSTATKKRAAQIIGNICSLADHKELVPYLDILLPDLRGTLLDPIPEVRAVTAKALGSLIKGMGEEMFPDLIPWLLDGMKSDAGSVERQGAAQGLAEVLGGMDPSRFENLLPEIVTLCAHPKPAVREGFLSVFAFLPQAFGAQFTVRLCSFSETPPKVVVCSLLVRVNAKTSSHVLYYAQEYLAQVLPPILSGLADEAEGVREISLKAAQVLVNGKPFYALVLSLHMR